MPCGFRAKGCWDPPPNHPHRVTMEGGQANVQFCVPASFWPSEFQDKAQKWLYKWHLQAVRCKENLILGLSQLLCRYIFSSKGLRTLQKALKRKWMAVDIIVRILVWFVLAIRRMLHALMTVCAGGWVPQFLRLGMRFQTCWALQLLANAAITSQRRNSIDFTRSYMQLDGISHQWGWNWESRDVSP